MPDELDIYRSAKLLIDRYGKDASLHCARRADEMLNKGDLDGFAVWRLIKRAVDELEAKEVPASAKIH